ncbi:MAG: CehA/McbA family metallohydrolase [Gammaproteobacteria bacterium]|nr:CehA/McbA family metallohydrolase [Gammaproteobacteria bacterium]
MNNLPFGRAGRFYRGNLHTHSTISDGLFTPQQVCRMYREEGYDFISLSEHFMSRFDYPVNDTRHLRDDSFTTLIATELHQGTTRLGELWHILAVGIPLDFARPSSGETAPQIARRAADSGAFIGIAHPSWNGLTVEDAKTIDCAHAIEIYNHGSQVEADRGVGWPLCDQLLNEGWRLSAYATDDAHKMTHDAFGGWIMVHAASLDPDALLESLKAGRYYSSTGPEIHDVRFEANEVHIKCDAASVICAQGRGSRALTSIGENQTSASFSLGKFRNAYLRLTVITIDGKRAWTNPVWFD